jgi:hypothetical protein
MPSPGSVPRSTTRRISAYSRSGKHGFTSTVSAPDICARLMSFQRIAVDEQRDALTWRCR